MGSRVASSSLARAGSGPLALPLRLALAQGLFCSLANAAPEPIQIALSAPAECPEEAVLVARISDILGGAAESEPALLASVAIEGSPADRYRARVHTRMGGVEGGRDLEGNSCEEVIAATALVLALLLQPERPEPEPELPLPEVAPVAARDPEREPPPEPEPAATPSESAPRPDVHARVGLGPGYGTLPGASAALWLAAGVSHRALALELRAGAWLPKTASATAEPDIGGSFMSFDGVIALCLRPEFGTWRWDGCAGFDGAFLRAEGRGAAETTVASANVAHGFFEQALAFLLLPETRLRVAAQGLLPLGRPRFSVRSVGEIHRPAAFALRGEIGVEQRF